MDILVHRDDGTKASHPCSQSVASSRIYMVNRGDACAIALEYVGIVLLPNHLSHQ